MRRKTFDAQGGPGRIGVSEIALVSWLTFAGWTGRGKEQACNGAVFALDITCLDTADVFAQGAAE